MRVVELFAGVGGFRLGLEAVSKDFYETIWANQWEPGTVKKQFAFRCYDSHFHEDSINVNKDINTVWREIPKHDLLVGGFPCQDYSVASTGAKGIEGKKGVLWWAINNIISSANRPRYLILENVDRLIKSPSKQRGRDFAIILRCLADQGYCVEWRVINAADYGFVQRRRRLFIFASLADQKIVKDTISRGAEDIISRCGFFANAFGIDPSIKSGRVESFDISKDSFDTLLDISERFQGRFYGAGIMRGYQIYTRDYEPVYEGSKEILRDVVESDVGPNYYVSEQDVLKLQYVKGAKRIKRVAPDGSEYDYVEGSISFPDQLDVPGRTMLTSEGTLNRSSHIVCDPGTGHLRILTPRECERLNGFPDDWTAGYMTERQRYFCMGNALVVPLVTRMGEVLKSMEGDSGDH